MKNIQQMMPKATLPRRIIHRTFLVLCGVWLVGSAWAQYTPASYIETNKDKAIAFMQEYGLPASVILAIAMHESANGNSKVARYLNNHFGIKGKNNSNVVRSAYKGYESVEASYLDFINLLQSRTAFSGLFDQCAPHDYRAWTRGIARGGYAHSGSWASKVIATIEKYRLHEYDGRPAGATDDTAATQSDKPAETYSVRRGDTLSYLARQHGTSVRDIMKKNGLTSSTLQIGQKLVF